MNWRSVLVICCNNIGLHEVNLIDLNPSIPLDVRSLLHFACKLLLKCLHSCALVHITKLLGLKRITALGSRHHFRYIPRVAPIELTAARLVLLVSMAPRRTRAMAAAEQEVANGSSQLSSPPATPASAKGRTTKRQKQLPNKKSQSVKSEPISPVVAPANTRKRARASPDHDRILDELPHNLGSIPTPDGSDEIEQAQALPKKRARRSAKSAEVKVEPEDIQALAQKVGIATPADVEKPAKTKQTKKNKYGFMPGQSPYPDWPHPTPEECYEVERLLSKEHGRVKPPDQIPVPSVTVAGCGEVPSVLDALIRTRLSAATSGTNSSRAFQGLVKRFGTIKEGIGKGSVGE